MDIGLENPLHRELINLVLERKGRSHFGEDQSAIADLLTVLYMMFNIRAQHGIH